MVQNKIVYVLLFLTLLCCFVFASDSITGYAIKDSVPLGENITAFGSFVDDANVNTNVLCSLYLKDTVSGTLVDRADDVFTDARGTFSFILPLTEPNFLRDENYTAQVVCGDATESKTFIAGNRRSIEHLASNEFEFVTAPENVESFLAWIFIGGFILVLVLALGWAVGGRL